MGGGPKAEREERTGAEGLEQAKRASKGAKVAGEERRDAIPGRPPGLGDGCSHGSGAKGEPLLKGRAEGHGVVPR